MRVFQESSCLQQLMKRDRRRWTAGRAGVLRATAYETGCHIRRVRPTVDLAADQSGESALAEGGDGLTAGPGDRDGDHWGRGAG